MYDTQTTDTFNSTTASIRHNQARKFGMVLGCKAGAAAASAADDDVEPLGLVLLLRSCIWFFLCVYMCARRVALVISKKFTANFS